MNTKIICCITSLLLSASFCDAQNVTSPYSILGIGDIDTKDFGRYFSSGNASLARRDPYSYNFSNPASLTALPLKLMNFDIAMRGRTSKFSSPETDTVTAATKDFIVKRISLAFKVDEKTGLAFGLRPYSSVNYKFQLNQAILDGNTTYTKSIEGSGGLNQIYVSAGKELSKKLSVGVTASWLFGSLQKTTQYSGASVSLDITRQETNFYYGGQIQGGIQYYSSPGKKWRHQLGLTSTISTGLNGQLTTKYSENGTSIQKDVETSDKFKLPVTVGLGYSAINKNNLSLSIEGNFYGWKYQKVDYTNSYTYPSMRLSAGMDYSFKKRQSNYVYERSFLSLGINAENSYLRIKNEKLWDYSFSFGGGLSLTRNISVYTGLEVGIKGNKTYDQIKEKYTQFMLGFTAKEIWIGSKRHKRYD